MGTAQEPEQRPPEDLDDTLPIDLTTGPSATPEAPLAAASTAVVRSPGPQPDVVRAGQPAWTTQRPIGHHPTWYPQTDRRDPGPAVLAIAWVLTVLTFGYFLPWAVAATRGRSNQAAVGLLTFLLGWTFIGWVAALVMACQSHQPIGPAGVLPLAVAAQVPPAGWYPAPDGGGQQWWDGRAWTHHRAP